MQRRPILTFAMKKERGGRFIRLHLSFCGKSTLRDANLFPVEKYRKVCRPVACCEGMQSNHFQYTRQPVFLFCMDSPSLLPSLQISFWLHPSTPFPDHKTAFSFRKMKNKRHHSDLQKLYSQLSQPLHLGKTQYGILGAQICAKRYANHFLCSISQIQSLVMTLSCSRFLANKAK